MVNNYLVLRRFIAVVVGRLELEVDAGRATYLEGDRPTRKHSCIAASIIC